MTPYITIKWSTHLFLSLWCHCGLLRAPLPVILFFPFAFWHALCGCLLNVTELSNYKDLFRNFTVCFLNNACTVYSRWMLDKKLVRSFCPWLSALVVYSQELSYSPDISSCSSITTVRENWHICLFFPTTCITSCIRLWQMLLPFCRKPVKTRRASDYKGYSTSSPPIFMSQPNYFTVMHTWQYRPTTSFCKGFEIKALLMHPFRSF